MDPTLLVEFRLVRGMVVLFSVIIRSSLYLDLYLTAPLKLASEGARGKKLRFDVDCMELISVSSMVVYFEFFSIREWL